jgi:hypothetical protein
LNLLEGNGAGLIRARAIGGVVQGALERLYRIERVADVEGFMVPAEEGREALLVREANDGAVEMALLVPAEMDLGFDQLCQLIEGVSHFVYLTHRADVGREATALEMELQAEVDKWVVLGSSLGSFDVSKSALLRKRLYDRVSFVHEEASDLGQRYRIANVAAERFVRSIERRYLARQRYAEMQDALRIFFRHGQEEKMRLGRAA